MSKRASVIRKLRTGRETAQHAGWKFVLTGKRIDAVTVTMAGAPIGKMWCRSQDNAQATAVWGQLLQPNTPCWIGPSINAGGDEFKQVDWSLGVSIFGYAVSTVAQPLYIDALHPQNVSGLGFLPGRLGPSILGGTRLHVEAFDHSGGRWLPATDGSNDPNVSAFYPTLPDQYGRIGVYLNPATNTLTAFAGEQEFDRNAFTDGDRALVPARKYPIGAVIVMTGGSISASSTFEDWRLYFDVEGGAGLAVNDGTTTVTGVTALTFAGGAITGTTPNATYTPPGGSGGGLDWIVVRDKKTSGTNGGTFTSGAWRTRDLNDLLVNVGSHASLSGNQVTLAAGTYRFTIECPAFEVNFHQARLYNITDSALVEVGRGMFAGASAVHNTSLVVGRFTIASSKVFEVQHRCTSTSPDTQGFGTGGGLGDEVFSICQFWKE